LPTKVIGANGVNGRYCFGTVVRSTSHYEDWLTGGIHMVPSHDSLSALRTVYQAMVTAGMFRGDAPTFEWVIERVTGLEAFINENLSNSA
jgi:hypothetical protein